MKRIAYLSIVVLSMLMCFGCSAKGPKFEPVLTIPEGEGLVYIYRPSGFIGSGVFYDVYAGEERICELVQGGYCTTYVKPGEVEIWAKTEAKSSVTLDVKASDVNYVKGGVGMGFFVGRPRLEVVPKEVGANEIEPCKKCVE